MPSLVHLPAELLLKVAKYVAAPKRDMSEYSEHNDRGRDYRSLSRLVRTCRQLFAIAQPVLYHSVGGPGGCGRLIRTLIQRPDLAAMVKDLYIGDDWGLDNNFRPVIRDEDHDGEDGDGEDGEQWLLSPDDAALFTKVVEKYQLVSLEESFGDDEAGEGEATPAVLPSVPSGGVDDDESKSLTGILATIAILQCLNVERIMLTTYYWTIAVPKKVDFTFNSFHELYLAHGDTEMSAGADRDLCWLFQAASSLARLKGHMIGSFSAKISSKSLRSLELTGSHIVEEEVEGIFRSFPNLELFAYHAGGATVAESDDGATPRQLVAAMSRCKETLKYIDLDWTDSFEMEYGDWDDGCLVETLKSFRNLEEAAVHLDGFGVDAESIDADFFKRVYPSSIRRVKWCRYGRRVQALDTACLLAISNTDFPHLQELSLVNYSLEESEREGIMRHFNDSGIRLKVTSTIFEYPANWAELMRNQEEGGEGEEDEEDEDDDK